LKIHFTYYQVLGDAQREAMSQIESTLMEVKDKSVRMLHKMVHDASGEVAATSVVVGIHIDANLRKAIGFPEDVRQRAVKMKEWEVSTLQVPA